MDSKLQQLTDKLFAEGLEKGRSESDRLIANAKSEAEKIVADAKAEAEKILKDASRAAEDVEKNSMTEISLAGKQAVAKIKSELAGVIVTEATAQPVKAAAMDAAFLTEMLLSVAKNWDGGASSKVSLEALLPEAKRAELDQAMSKSADALLAAGITVGYSAQVKSGFKVAAKDGGYYISFSDEDFDALLRSYLREKVADLLFKA